MRLKSSAGEGVSSGAKILASSPRGIVNYEQFVCGNLAALNHLRTLIRREEIVDMQKLKTFCPILLMRPRR